MSILSDGTIKLLSSAAFAKEANGGELPDGWRPMIEPFHPRQIREHETPLGMGSITEKIISYGLSSYGYDVTLQPKFQIFTNVHSGVIDPLRFDPRCLVDIEGEHCVIPPQSYALAPTRERFIIPRDVSVICVGKSTYARCGIAINVTPIESGFEGEVVIEIANLTSLPVKIYANMGIAQFCFFRGDKPCEVSYADRKGKYQGQTGITTAKA